MFNLFYTYIKQIVTKMPSEKCKLLQLQKERAKIVIINHSLTAFFSVEQRYVGIQRYIYVSELLVLFHATITI